MYVIVLQNLSMSINSTFIQKSNNLCIVELERLDIDNMNMLYNVTPEVKNLLRLYFILINALIQFIMLSEDGFGVKIAAISEKNIKLIGSAIFHIVIDICEELVPVKNKIESYGTKEIAFLKKIYP